MRIQEATSTELGKRLKEARKILKIQQKDMAEAIQIQPSYLCQIENGNANPGPEFFVRLASLYNINLNYLFLGAQDLFITDEGEVKENEVDLNDEIDTTEKLIWLINNSIHVRLVLQTHVNQLLHTEKENIRRDIERKKAREKELKEY